MNIPHAAATPYPAFTLLSFDSRGEPRDRRDLLAGLVEAVRRDDEPITDVFVFSHGWLNDRSQALESYHAWVRVMTEYYLVRQAEIRRRRPGFRPLLIGVHWPSAPWEDQRTLSSIEQRVAFYTELIGDPSAADELWPLLLRAEATPDPDVLSRADEARLNRLDERSGLRADKVGAAPGDDRESFDAARIFADFKTFWRGAGAGPLRSLLAPLWVTGFWKMKRRALDVGSTGVHRLLRTLQEADREKRVRFHLIGHSFGGIVCASALQGPPDGGPPLAPVHSLTLLQGALSLWSFAGVIPDSGRSGYFHPITKGELVAGPVITTRSRHDLALRWFFRAAAKAGQDNRLGRRARRLPRYGAAGSYGLAGLGDRAVDLTARPGQLRYRIEPGRCHNVEGSDVIVGGLSLNGAHSNLVHPELAGLVWEAATSSPDRS